MAVAPLTGRRCIVTGASRGLGAAIAARFWSAGADLLLVARSGDALARLRDSLKERPRQRAYLLTCDLAKSDAPARIAEEARVLFGGSLSVLVNNAGSQGPIGLASENDWDAWEHTLRLNLLSVIDLTRRCVPLLSSGGKVITISGGGATGPRPRFTAYATAKAGLVRFCETLAQEVQPFGIDVNCVAPGAMNSAMTDAILAAGPEQAGTGEYESALRLKQQGSEIREGAATLCAFLASAESDGISGKLISARWDPWQTLPARVEDLRRTDVYTLRRIVPSDRSLSWGDK